MNTTFGTALPGLAFLALCAGCQTDGRLAKAAIPAADFYVATDGNDAWSGTLPAPTGDGTDGPFATLRRARDAVRSAKAAGGITGGGTVVVRGGFYAFAETLVLDARDAGTAEAPAVYRTCPGEKVQLCGGVSVPPDAFRPASDPGIRKRLDAAVRDKVLAVDLGPVGITDLGAWPMRFRGAPKVPELFFDDERMPLVRWSEEGWTTIAEIIPGRIHA